MADQETQEKTPFDKAKTEMLRITKPFDIVHAFEQGWCARGEADEELDREGDEEES